MSSQILKQHIEHILATYILSQKVNIIFNWNLIIYVKSIYSRYFILLKNQRDPNKNLNRKSPLKIYIRSEIPYEKHWT